MPPAQQAQRGYLLLADISGYTAFLTGHELEHANEIVRELTTLIRQRLEPLMRFVKLEGDAVFCHAPDGSFETPERLLELIEATYLAFSDRLLNMSRETTCECSACAAIDSLDLKFVVHYGDYLIDSDTGTEDLAGPDVILVHRLLKNGVCESGGPDTYALFSGACMERMPEGLVLPEHCESYDSFGDVSCGVHDLAPALERLRDANRIFIDSNAADIEMTVDAPIDPAVMWQYCVDPRKRLRWQPMQTAIYNRPNKQGRMAAGAASHCAHGPAGDLLREYVDWRPYEYFSIRTTPVSKRAFGLFPGHETLEFVPTEGGTRLYSRFKLDEDVNRRTRARFRTSLVPFSGSYARTAQRRLAKALVEDGVVEE